MCMSRRGPLGADQNHQNHHPPRSSTATHVLDGPHHVVGHGAVEALIWDADVGHAPGAQDQLPIGVEVDGADDGRVPAEVADDVLCFQL